MALANINVAVTESNISVDLQNTTVAVSSTTSNVIVGTASSARFIEDVFNAGSVSGNVTLDLQDGSIQNVVLTGNITGLTVTNLDIGSSLTLIATQDGIGGRSLDLTTYTSNWTTWEFINDYTELDTNPNHYSIINLFRDSSNIFASLLTEDAPPVQNSDLANANIIVNGTTISLGSSGNIANFGPLTTDDLTEGSTNQYFTDAKSRASVSASTIAGLSLSNGSLSYNSSNGTFTFQSAGVPQNTGFLPEGINLYYTNARADARITGYTGALVNLTGNVTTTANVICNNLITTDTIEGSGTFGHINLTSDTGVVIQGTQDVSNDLGYMANVNIQELKYIRFNNPGDDGIWIQGSASGSTRNVALGRNISMLGASNINMHSFDTHADNDTANINLVISPTAAGSVHQGGVLHTAHIYNPGNTITNYHTGTNKLDIRSVGNIDLNSAGTVATISSTGVYADYFHGDASNMTGLASNTDAVAFIATVPLTVGGNLTVNGNIDATGNINYQNVTDLYVTDQKITLNANATTDATVEIIANRPQAGANTVIRWNETDDKWQFSNDGSAYNDLLTSSASRALVSATDSGGLGSFAYTSGTGVFEYTGPSNSDVRGLVSVTDAGGLGSLAYNNSTGVITYTGASTAEVRSLVDVVTTSASGGGTLAYDSGTGDFTFAPADMTGAISNAQAQAFIQSSGLTMTAAISSNSLISTTGNLDLNISTAVDNLYGVRFDSATNKFISSPSITSEAPTHFITIEKESTDLELIRSRIARSGANGTRLLFEKSEGTLASPVALGDFDTVWETEYSGWDGAKYENSFGTHVFQDRETAVTSADTVPLAYEFYAKPSGDTTSNDISIMSLHSDGKIVFNDAGGSRGYNDKIGTANISRDGSIVSAANITATGNISGGNILGTVRGGIDTTSNIDSINSINLTYPDTVLSGIVLKADSPGAGTTVLDVTSARSGDGGPQNSYKKATGTIASPGAIGTRDYVKRELYYGHDGTDYINTFGTMVYQDSDVGGVSTNVVPLAYEIYTNNAGDSTDGYIQSIVRYDSNRNIIFNDNGTRTFGDGQGNANITQDGTINTVSAINATGNITGNYIKGDGSQLTNLPASTDSFGTVTVAGQTNIQASQGNAILDIASSGDITLTTAGNTLTIGGSGSGYGNAEVTTYLASGTSTGNVAFTGNLIVESGNTSYSPSAYDGSVSTGNVDRITFSSDPGFYAGQPVLFSGTTNSDLVFLNNNVYYLKHAGVSNAYDIYTDAGTTTGLQSGLGSETPNSLAASVRNESNNRSDFFGNVNISSGSTLNVSTIKPFVTGGTFSMTGLRVADVALGSGGADFFWPETGGNTEGGLLVSSTDRVGTWQQGYVATFEDKSGPEVMKITNNRSTSLAIEEIYKKARGTTASPTVLLANDRIHEIEYYGHDGSNYLETIGEHTYVDTNSGTIGTGVMPLSKEFYVRPDGILADSRKSVLKLRANRAIEFNASEERGFSSSTGNANVTADGSINSVSTITGLNIKSDQFVQFKNYTTTEINALSGMAAGDTVYNTTEETICFYTGSAWKKVTSSTL